MNQLWLSLLTQYASLGLNELKRWSLYCRQSLILLEHPSAVTMLNNIYIALVSDFHTAHLRGAGWWSEKIKFNPDRLISSAACLPNVFLHAVGFPSVGGTGLSALILLPSYFVVMLSTTRAGQFGRHRLRFPTTITHRCFRCIINHTRYATWFLHQSHRIVACQTRWRHGMETLS